MTPRQEGGGRRLPVPDDIRGRTRAIDGDGPRVSRGGGSPGPGGAAPPSGPATVFAIDPPWVIRPSRAQDFNRSAQVQGQSTGSVEPAALQVTIPSGSVAVIRSLTISVSDLLTTSDLTWALLENGSRIQGWGELTVFPSNSSVVSKSWGPEETYIPVSENSTLSVRITVDDAGTYGLGADYHGWQYPATTDQRYRRAGI